MKKKQKQLDTKDAYLNMEFWWSREILGGR